jgi:shikimate kinase
VVTDRDSDPGSDPGSQTDSQADSQADSDPDSHPESEGATGPCVVLIGPPGSGKTTVGRALATLLGVDLRDTDQAIEAQQGRSISDLFVDEGEPRFRELERAEVASSLVSHRGVLSLGGGAVMDPTTASALAGHTVVFLDVGIADAATRVGFNQSRPLLVVNPRAQWIRMMDIRRPTYERLATFTVLTTGRTPQDIAAEIAQRLEQTGIEQTGLEQTGLEQAELEQAGLEQAELEQAELEQAELEQTGREQTGHEQTELETDVSGDRGE